RRGSFEIFFGCRKDETDLADRVYPSSFLMGVVRPRFRFRPDPMRRQTPIHGVWALPRSKPDGLPRPLRPILQERTHLGPLPFRASQDALGVARKYPRVAAVPASVADHFGVIRGITQHDDARPFRQRQFANQIGCRLGCGAVDQALLLAVLAFVIRFAERNPRARWSDQETHREAVTVLLSVFVFAVATPFPRPFFTVAGAVGVFRFLSCLTGQRGVDDIYEQAVGSLSLQQPLPQDGVDIELPPPRPR